MSRNIDIVIQRFKSRALDNRNEQHYWENRPNPNANTLEYAQKACKRAEENEQIVAWLEELKTRREADKWISVDEALPEKEGDYLVDRKERTFSIQYFFFGTADHKPYWSGECKVYYWRPLPKAPESEDSK